MNKHAVATPALALCALLGSCGGTGNPPTSNPPISTPPQHRYDYCQDTAASLSTGTSGPPANGTSGIEGTGFQRNAIVSNGRISGLGSIFVGGIEYSLDSATILVDGRMGAGSDLNVGQVVTVLGFAYVDTSGIEGTGFNRNTALTGTATTVTATTDIGGPIETISADGSFLTVLGQSVEIDQLTRATTGLQPGTFVSISGFRNSKGIWSARYMHVERTVMPLHLSGIVTGLAADKTFKIGNLVVDSASAQLSGFPSGIAEGDNVRVTGTSLDSSGTLVAEKVVYINPALPGNPGDDAEIEGWVTRFVSAQDFDVNEHHVASDSHTSPSSLALDRFARVFGTRDKDGGVVAEGIDVCTLTGGSPRSGHKAVLLSNGKVLLTGGPYCGEELELFDPSTQTFEPAGFLASSDEGQSATLLADGKVLFEGYVAGEVYDPTTQQFVGTGSRVNAPHRGNVTAARLLDGRVLIAGGHPNSRSAWLYDPLTNRFNAVGDMISARADHTETLLPSGDVLIAGGWNGTYREAIMNDPSPPDPQFVELFSPKTLTFQKSACMAATRTGHTATSLANGDVLLLGGDRGGGMPDPPASLPYAEVFSATSHTIHALSTPDLSGSPVLLPTGKVVLLGGTSAEVLDPVTGIVTVAPGLITARTAFSATLLPDGRVLVIGGIDENGTTLASFEYWSGSN